MRIQPMFHVIHPIYHYPASVGTLSWRFINLPFSFSTFSKFHSKIFPPKLLQCLDWSCLLAIRATFCNTYDLEWICHYDWSKNLEFVVIVSHSRLIVSGKRLGLAFVSEVRLSLVWLHGGGLAYFCWSANCSSRILTN